MPLITLIESAPGSLNYLLQPRNYTQLYNKLKTSLNTEEILLFTRPDIYDASTNWSADLPIGMLKLNIVSYNNLNDGDRTLVGETIVRLKNSIQEKLKSNKDFGNIIDLFFEIPSTDDIYVVNIAGSLQPFFTRWGCKLVNASMDMNPLTRELDKFSLPTSDVTLLFSYSNGRIASNVPFFYSFLGKDSVQKTDDSGMFNLGKLRSGTAFSVSEIRNNNKGETIEFVAMEGQSYKVFFPVYITGSVTVKDDQQKLLSNKSISVFHEGVLSVYMTDSNGRIDLKGLRVGGNIVFSDSSRPDITLTQEIQENNAHFTFVIKEQKSTYVRVRVEDVNKTKLAGYPVFIKIGETDALEYKTNNEGLIEIANCVPGHSINITDKNKLDNRINYVLQEGENDFLLFSDILAGKNFVRIKLVNHRNEPMPGIPIGLTYRNLLTQYTTDKNGEFILPKEQFLDETKVAASITTQKIDKKGNLIDKIVNKQFTYTSNKDLYLIKLSRLSNWWWLLLILLLPLLLLIRLEKTIYVQCQRPDHIEALTGANVYLSYHKEIAFDSGSLFTNNLMEYNEKTNKKGVSSFIKLEYSVYSYLFHYGSPLKVFVKSECYENDTLLMKFHAVSNNDTIKIVGKPKLVHLNFRVVDEITNYPIRHSKVRFIGEDGSIKYEDSSFTNSQGIIDFNVPLCGNIKWSVASKEGYLSDSINNRSVNDLFSDDIDQSRQYKLTPIDNSSLGMDSSYVDDMMEDVTHNGGHFGQLSVSMAWNTIDDIDLAVQEPNGDYITFRNKSSINGGTLELDITNPSLYSNPVEHIYWNSNPMPGLYKVFVNCYSIRSNFSTIPIRILINKAGVTNMVDAQINNRNIMPGRLLYQFRYPN